MTTSPRYVYRTGEALILGLLAFEGSCTSISRRTSWRTPWPPRCGESGVMRDTGRACLPGYRRAIVCHLSNWGMSRPGSGALDGGKRPVFIKESEWCRGAESNCRHHDFQSCALPTELPRHVWKDGAAGGTAASGHCGYDTAQRGERATWMVVAR